MAVCGSDGKVTRASHRRVDHHRGRVNFRPPVPRRPMREEEGQPQKRGHRKPREIQERVIEFAKTTGFGDTRIIGELRKLGVKKISRSPSSGRLLDEESDPVVAAQCSPRLYVRLTYNTRKSILCGNWPHEDFSLVRQDSWQPSPEMMHGSTSVSRVN